MSYQVMAEVARRRLSRQLDKAVRVALDAHQEAFRPKWKWVDGGTDFYNLELYAHNGGAGGSGSARSAVDGTIFSYGSGGAAGPSCTLLGGIGTSQMISHDCGAKAPLNLVTNDGQFKRVGKGTPIGHQVRVRPGDTVRVTRTSPTEWIIEGDVS